MAVHDNNDLITLTADIVSAHVANNAVHTGDVANLISAVYGALNGLGAPAAETESQKLKGAVSARASVKVDRIISMIDGKPYKMLRRHIAQHGYTPETYREAFGLPRDYPMVAAEYAGMRRDLANKIGLGRRPKVEAPVKRGRKPALAEAIGKVAGATVDAAVETLKPKRGRKPKVVEAAEG
jgi:predicted transcriptional regulator